MNDDAYLLRQVKSAICAVTDCRRRDCKECPVSEVTLATAGDIKIKDLFSGSAQKLQQKKEPTRIEVIRCKDCKFYNAGKTIEWRMCLNDAGLLETTPDSFCSHAVRRK